MSLNVRHKNEYLFIESPKYPLRHRSAPHMAIIFFIIVAFGYIGLRSSTFFSPPYLVVDKPVDGATVVGNMVTVAGSTDPETRITVNEHEFFSSSDGSFSISLPLHTGYNILDIRVKNRIGNISKVVRRIVVE